MKPSCAGAGRPVDRYQPARRTDPYGESKALQLTSAGNGGSMKRTSTPHLRDALAPPTDDESSRVVARPDGFYWVADDGHQQFGPFETAQDALAALREGLESGLEPDETLEQAESEIGFVDPKVADADSPED
jgi:hypothetical protein